MDVYSPAHHFTLSPPAQNLISGTVAGWVQVVVGFPFDTVKVNLQTNGSKYRSAIECLGVLYRKYGFLGLYKGSTSPLMGNGLCNAVLFTTNETFRRLIGGGEKRTLSLREIGTAGAYTGAVMAFFNTPVELLKVQLQTESNNKKFVTERKYNGVIDAGIQIFKKRRITGLYHGITITVLRDIPSFATYFSGGTAGIACWIPCYPQDVIKSQMQKNLEFKSTIECFRAIISNARATNTSIFKTFSRGFGPTMARAFPANAATFLAYEMTLSALRNY
ncbi:8490_t:CDS:2 [Diversispora eburnea]|uniref:8490_t:CDS:1 n=1 Tax=Diversispora eburnea TaxID=1213867 RepID=A0A9N8WEG3_9GLOM|nr:8490_t:CDS:2 [Diversispora eburnea]